MWLLSAWHMWWWCNRLLVSGCQWLVTITGFPWFASVRMNIRCELWNQNRFALIRTHSVRTQWFTLSGGAHHGNAWFAPFKAVFWLWRLKIVLYFICVLRSHRILLQIWYVTFQIMKLLGLFIGLQTFAVVLGSFWNRTGVICRTVSSISRKFILYW